MSLDRGSKGLDYIHYLRFTPDNLRKFVSESPHQKGLPQPPFEKEFDEKVTLFELPSIDSVETNDVGLREAILGRRSIRNYSEKALTLGELSWLLYATQGIQGVYERGTIWASRVNDCRVSLRPVANGGGLHPFETYLLVRSCEGLDNGLYRYIASRHGLFPVDLSDDIDERVSKGCLTHIGKMCPVLFIWTAVPYRTGWHYGELVYKAVNIDVGHVSQNLYLAAEGVDCAVCAVGYYDEDVYDKVLEIDGSSEYVAFTEAVGKKPDVILDP